MTREILNSRKENEGFMTELKRTQGMNREIISDYLSLMNTKGNEDMFLSKHLSALII